MQNSKMFQDLSAAPHSIAAVVLAGGRSRRFGRDKAVAHLAGESLLTRSSSPLKAVATRLAISGPIDLARAYGLEAIADYPGLAPGPLAGIVAALDWARVGGDSHLLTAPCDTPFLPADLAARLAQGVGSAAVAAARAGQPHPLCAIWRTDQFDALLQVARLERQPALRALIDQLGGVWISFPDETAFANLNTPQDFAEAQLRLGEAGS